MTGRSKKIVVIGTSSGRLDALRALVAAFPSAAQVFGPGAIGVTLTGNLDNGIAGLWTIKRLGGVAVVQEPGDALYDSMPRAALAHVDADHVVPLAQMPSLLTALAADP